MTQICKIRTNEAQPGGVPIKNPYELGKKVDYCEVISTNGKNESFL